MLSLDAAITVSSLDAAIAVSSLDAAHRLLIAVTSLVAEHGL